MKSTFSEFHIADNVNNYTIETFDNGVLWQLRLVEKSTGDIVDSLNLERSIIMSGILPIWLDEKVIQSKFNRQEWSDEAPEEALQIVKDMCNQRNNSSLREFINEHNTLHEEHEVVMRWIENY